MPRTLLLQREKKFPSFIQIENISIRSRPMPAYESPTNNFHLMHILFRKNTLNFPLCTRDGVDDSWDGMVKKYVVGNWNTVDLITENGRLQGSID